MTPALVGQVAKIVAMLSSDQDHEVLAAVRALKRTLASERLDVFALADAIKAGADRLTPSVPRQPPPRALTTPPTIRERIDTRTRVEWLYASQWHRLGDWEQQVIKALKRRVERQGPDTLSVTERMNLDQIFARVTAGVKR